MKRFIIALICLPAALFAGNISAINGVSVDDLVLDGFAGIGPLDIPSGVSASPLVVTLLAQGGTGNGTSHTLDASAAEAGDYLLIGVGTNQPVSTVTISGFTQINGSPIVSGTNSSNHSELFLLGKVATGSEGSLTVTVDGFTSFTSCLIAITGSDNATPTFVSNSNDTSNLTLLSNTVPTDGVAVQIVTCWDSPWEATLNQPSGVIALGSARVSNQSGILASYIDTAGPTGTILYDAQTGARFSGANIIFQP